MEKQNLEQIRTTITQAALDSNLLKLRIELANLASVTFLELGEKLHVTGHIIGEDRNSDSSQFGHGSDEVVGVGILLQIAGHLAISSSKLLISDNPYAGAALLRQLVEVEYLAWAFETRDEDSQRWLRSDKKLRLTDFSPKKLRDAAGGKFRGKDYGFHCEWGGHPTPHASKLLSNDNEINQLLLSDLLAHCGGVWNHFLGWANKNKATMAIFSNSNIEWPKKFAEWEMCDPMAKPPPPPL